MFYPKTSILSAFLHTYTLVKITFCLNLVWIMLFHSIP